MRPSSAGPMDAPFVHESSRVESVLKWRMPPTEMMFFAQACGRDWRSPLLLWDCVIEMSSRQMMSSICCDTLLYAVVSALPYYLNITVAEAARAAGVHYFDLTEDVATTRRAREIAAGGPSAFVPQCGLAPGFISIVAMELARRFDRLEAVRMRVGALPKYPTNALSYNLTWSTDGLINEYCNPCQAIRDGGAIETLPLEEVESFSLDGIDYEAFNTSGGLGTLSETLKGRVENLNYKTVRYPGHRDIVKTLVRDLRLDRRRDLLKDVLEAAIPMTMQDVVLIYVSVTGFGTTTLLPGRISR